MISKRISAVVVAIFMVSLCAMASSGSAGKDVKWTLEKGVLTFSGKGPMKDFGNDLPYRPDLVEKIVVQEGITTIGNNMARGCKNLLMADIPSSVISIGDYAFYKCKRLTDAKIPYGVEHIGERAFMGCQTFIEVEFPISLRTVGAEAFANCSNLISARLNSSLETLGSNAFANDKLLTTLDNLPSYIDTDSFYEYGLNRSAVKNYWNKKEEIAQRFGNSSGSTIQPAVAKEIQPSEVDLNIPFTGRNNPNTFAVIIANENYGKLVNVPYALNDGNTFALYCQRTLGIPEKNVLRFNDASYGAMREAMSTLRLINDVVGEDMKLIFYYAGHGAPDDATLEPYIIPVDAARIDKNVCISLASIYREVGEMKLKSATFFMDACFSGATRDGGMMAYARGIARVPKKQGLMGNMAVFSATSNEQTALPYNEKGHGMFTYHLLRHLQDTKGEATLADLHDYLKENVSRDSSIINRKEQTPTVNVSTDAVTKWVNWKLND